VGLENVHAEARPATHGLGNRSQDPFPNTQHAINPAANPGISSKRLSGSERTVLIWGHTLSRVIEGDLWEVSLMIGGSDQNGIAEILLAIGNGALGRSEKGRTRGAFIGIRGRHPYSNGGAEI